MCCVGYLELNVTYFQCQDKGKCTQKINTDHCNKFNETRPFKSVNSVIKYKRIHAVH